MLWQQDILDRENDSSMTSGTIERLGAEKPDEDEEGYAGMTFFGDDVDFGLMATVDFDPMEAADATIDLGIDEDIVFGDEDEIARFYEDGVPIDEDGPVRLSVHDDSSGSTPLSSDPLIQPPFPVPPTRTPRGVSWPNPVAWFGSALVAIGFMIGGSDATTLGAPPLHRGSPSVARDPNSAWNRLQTSRPVGSCCQGSAWEEATHFQLEGVDVRSKTRKTTRSKIPSGTRSSENDQVEDAEVATQRATSNCRPTEEQEESAALSRTSVEDHGRPGQAPGQSMCSGSK
jgi:hypothetical protein